MISWIRGIIYTALFCTLALALTPEGRVKTAEKLICGAVLLFAVFSPLFGFNSDKYALSLTKYSEIGKQLAEQGSESSERLNRTFIEEELSAYILDKAENIGIKVEEISVGVAWSDDGYWYPVSLSLSGVFTESDQEKLSAVIAAELGIDINSQRWTEVSQ